MNFNDGKSDIGSISQSPESRKTTNTEEDGASPLDKSAMESAKRAQNRIHADEGNIPGSTVFTK